jgi:PAS domain S-box-containing protein
LARLILRASPDWARIGESVRGPLLTLLAAVVLDVMRRHDVGLVSPFPVLMLTIVYSAYVGGLSPALVSVVITVLDALHFFAKPGLPLHYDPPNGASMAVVSCCALLTGLAVARLRDRARHGEVIEQTRSESGALARRFAILEQASLILGSTRDADAIFRDLSRLIVPTLADWCTIHLINEQGVLRLAAAADRDPSRDLVVRTLAEFRPQALPFEPAALSPEVVRVDDALLRDSAADPEELKLYQALGAREVLRVPLHSADRQVGFLTLGLSAEHGRHFPAADLELIEEMARGSAVALDNARLRHDVRDTDLRARLVFEAHPQAMWIFDVDTLAFLAVNEAAIHSYGWTRDEFLGMTIMDLLAPDDPAQPASVIDRGPIRGEAALAHHRRRDGTLLDVELVSHEMELDGRRARLVLATDITERARTRAALHQSEQQLRQAQRSEALGRIAGGVAHDFNNLLTTIRGFGEMLLHDLVPDDRRRQDVQRICQAADRGALLTRQLLTFGKTRGEDPRPVNLNDLVRGMEPLVQRLVGADVRLDVRLATGLGQVRVDPAQLEHVVVNLILNARDAMPSGGRLWIETSLRRISGLSGGRPVRPGRYVVLTVGDSGPGVEEEVESSDDAPSRKGGLGRAIVFGIVRQYGGVVRVSTEPGEGTTVKVYLPRIESGEEEEIEPVSATMRGSETILVAEDEDGVRELLQKALTEFGYTVLVARHGRDALIAAGDRVDGIDVLVTDVVMPEMSGRELADTLQARRPDLKVLYISGYTDDEVLQRGISGREVGLLRKPFAAEELVRRVRALLDGAPV